MTNATLPKPSGKVVNFDQIASIDQATDYALAGFHASTGKAANGQGPTQRLWQDAAAAYSAAYAAIAGLKIMPSPDTVEKAKGFLHDANHLADQAAAAK